MRRIGWEYSTSHNLKAPDIPVKASTSLLHHELMVSRIKLSVQYIGVSETSQTSIFELSPVAPFCLKWRMTDYIQTSFLATVINAWHLKGTQPGVACLFDASCG
jgi:hypothetical protein